MDNKIVFWWNIPCAGMIGVLKEYTEKIDNTAIVVTGSLSRSRKEMGWEDKGKMFENHIVISDSEWESKGKDILIQYRDRLHVFNCITYPNRIKNLINTAITENINYCNMSEAYANLEYGFKGIIKNIYIKFIIPLKSYKVIKHSSGVLCLSGSSNKNLNQFRTLGFKNEKIFGYGYYTNNNPAFKYSNVDDKIHILCPGLHEKYKGVDILIRALANVKNKGYSNVICHITGKGSQTKSLIELTNKLHLNDIVKFEGVLNNNDYEKLLSCIDILVAPGRIEPWGIRINEAIQRGNAVIVSDGLGASELIQESKGGCVFKSGDIRDLANSIELLIDGTKLNEAKKNNVNYAHIISCENQAYKLHQILKSL